MAEEIKKPKKPIDPNSAKFKLVIRTIFAHMRE